MSSFYTCAPKITNIWYILPEICSATDIIFCHFWAIFYLFTPLFIPKIKFGKNVKIPLEILSFYTYVALMKIMMYGSCNTRHGKQNFLSFWAIFLHLTLLATQKINIFKKMKKKLWRDYHFTLVYHKWWSYDVWFLRHETQNTIFFVIFNYFFFTPKQPGKSKFWKNGEKKGQRHHHFSYVYHEWQSYDVWFLKYEARQTELFSPSFYASVPKIKIICYTASEIWCVRDVIIIFQFGPFFTL